MAEFGLNRVAFTYISDTTAPEELYKEELAVNHEVPMISVKTPVNGNVISYDYLTRLDNHVNKLIQSSMNYGLVKGSILSFTPHALILPTSTGVTDINFFEEYNANTEFGCHEIILSIDLDCTTMEDKKINKDYRHDIMIEYEFCTQLNGEDTVMYSGTLPLAQFNDECFAFKEINDNIQIQKLIIHSVPDETLRYTLHSICAFARRNEFYRIIELNVLHEHTNLQIIGTTFDRTGLVVEGVRGNGMREIVTDYDTDIYYIGPEEDGG